MGEERGGVGPTMNERSAGDVAEKSEKRKVSNSVGEENLRGFDGDVEQGI